MKQIIIVKPGSVSQEAKKELLCSGHVLIEHENPEEVRIVSSLEGIKGDDILSAALKAILDSFNDDVRVKFASNVCRNLNKGK